jgi:hypothetical protein
LVLAFNLNSQVVKKTIHSLLCTFEVIMYIKVDKFIMYIEVIMFKKCVCEGGAFEPWQFARNE